VKNYVEALVKCRDSDLDAGETTRLITAYDEDMITRGALAVNQSLQEANKALKLDTVSQMIMSTK
jgi:hypothetical protein